MKKLIVISLLLFVGSYGFGQTDTISTSDYIRKGEIVYYKDSLFTGVALKKAENGQVVEEQLYKNGKAHGLWREWYATGEKKFEGSFVNGVGDGDWIQWNKEGKSTKELTFKDGRVVMPNK